MRMGERGDRDPGHLLSRCHVAAAELGLPAEAVVLVRQALENLARECGPGAGSDRVTPAALCAGLLRCDVTPERSAEQLRGVGLYTSELVGRVVGWLAADGVIRPRPGESPADYRGQFDLTGPAFRDS
jgi:hypothetical protein